MKTRKSIYTVYDDTPFDQWTLNGNGTQCQDVARKFLEEQHADRLRVNVRINDRGFKHRPSGLPGDDTAPNSSVAAHGTGGNKTDLIPLGQSVDLTKQNPRAVMNDNEILQYFEAADLSDGL